MEERGGRRAPSVLPSPVTRRPVDGAVTSGGPPRRPRAGVGDQRVPCRRACDGHVRREPGVRGAAGAFGLRPAARGARSATEKHSQ